MSENPFREDLKRGDMVWLTGVAPILGLKGWRGKVAKYKRGMKSDIKRFLRERGFKPGGEIVFSSWISSSIPFIEARCAVEPIRKAQ